MRQFVMAAVVISHLARLFPAGFGPWTTSAWRSRTTSCSSLMGPSGCGKTTTLRLLAGLEQPTAGRIVIAGRAARAAAAAGPRRGHGLSARRLYPHLSVRGNLGFGLQLRRTPQWRDPRRVEEAAAALGISELLDRRPGELSYGQQQRVALGRAIVRRPKLFLLDEPLASLDAALRRQLRARDPRPAPAARRADDLRDARRRRGDGPGPADRGPARRPLAAGGRSANALRPARQPVRRLAAGQPGNEFSSTAASSRPMARCFCVLAGNVRLPVPDRCRR